MGNKGEAKRDFPASEPHAGLLDEGPGKSVPKKRLPADKKSSEQALAGLKTQTGFQLPTEANQEPLPPVKIFANHDPRPPTMPEQPKKIQEPKKITPPLIFIHDPERIMKITSDPHILESLHISERKHQVDLWKQRRRAEQNLPPRKLSFKEMGRLLTKEEIAILTDKGYDLQKMRRDTPSYEKMLLDLKQYQAQHKEKIKV